MKCLNLTFDTPAANLACDEALLELCENGFDHEVLRFWESREYFVVAGYANQAAAEANLLECAADNIPVLRRCSGGGAVLQGPGCLNYSLVLRIDEAGPTAGITETNSFVMQANRKALQRLTSERIEVRGHTDLAIEDVKFSGNAQRRKRRFLLFHGSFLLGFDLARISRFLRQPSQQPDYRRNRPHREFVRNLEVPAESVRDTLASAWRAIDPLDQAPGEIIDRLVREKYSRDDWNLKF